MSKAGEFAKTGAKAGGVLGGLGGAIQGALMGAVGGLPTMAAGALAGGVVGAVSGAITWGIGGAAIGAFVKDDKPQQLVPIETAGGRIINVPVEALENSQAPDTRFQDMVAQSRGGVKAR